uniref:chymotrypsin-1-like n=1 Tax=Anopheles coluzzii TaxID=1518534 RepID=UPI0020FFD6E2|nr:chymotrypsin-1-like [Anopheles coluzzii]XP_040238910.2 chymotrypsin-1-like [Anopheles coluzzii]
MKVVAICVVLLVKLLFHGSVLANSSAEAESNTDNGNEQSSPSVRESVDTNANSSHSGRIINGKQGNVATFPYIVRMRVKNEGYCGATIITYWHVFTAAHCVYHIEDPATITMYGGSASQTSGGVVFSPSKIVIHPQYNSSTLDYDAAIIRVNNTFQGYKTIAPIALQVSDVPVKTKCYVIGWGWTQYATKATPDIMQYAMLQVVPVKKCASAYIYVPKDFICAFQGNGVDICHGDSGGPFVCEGKLAGATSFVGPGCQGQIPSGFTKISAPSIRQFIRKHAGI